jgi:hypothetical protein
VAAVAVAVSTSAPAVVAVHSAAWVACPAVVEEEDRPVASPSRCPNNTHITTTTTTLRFKHIIQTLIRVYTLGRTLPTDFIHWRWI